MAQGGSHLGRPAGPLTGVVRLSGRYTCSLVALEAPTVHPSNSPLPAIPQGGNTASLASTAAPQTHPRASQASLGAMGAPRVLMALQPRRRIPCGSGGSTGQQERRWTRHDLGSNPGHHCGPTDPNPAASRHAAFAERDLRNIRPAVADQSALMPANLTTFAHLSVSSAMNFPNSAGVIVSGSAPNSARCDFILRSARAALI
jgi:hypothetical protein